MLFGGLRYGMAPGAESRAWKIDFEELLPGCIQESGVPPVELVFFSQISHQDSRLQDFIDQYGLPPFLAF